MNDVDDGGPAFPRPFSLDGNNEAWSQDGMSLRDYFAAKVMHAEIATAGMHEGAAVAMARAAEVEGQYIEERIACLAYHMADEMLKARLR